MAGRPLVTETFRDEREWRACIAAHRADLVLVTKGYDEHGDYYTVAWQPGEEKAA